MPVRFEAQLAEQQRHCERSEAIRKNVFEIWIASSLALLAMTLLRSGLRH